MTEHGNALAISASGFRWNGRILVVGLAIVTLTGVAWAQMPDFGPPHDPEHLLVRFLPSEVGSCTLCI